ncbi:hypothetical protein F4777DRAFT_580107 [Nemania sp. FL0916]|nr:hypothetical protein F4777DRAFT_580107 [Nemania sp. FL0916]
MVVDINSKDLLERIRGNAIYPGLPACILSLASMGTLGDIVSAGKDRFERPEAFKESNINRDAYLAMLYDTCTDDGQRNTIDQVKAYSVNLFSQVQEYNKAQKNSKVQKKNDSGHIDEIIANSARPGQGAVEAWLEPTSHGCNMLILAAHAMNESSVGEHDVVHTRDARECAGACADTLFAEPTGPAPVGGMDIHIVPLCQFRTLPRIVWQGEIVVLRCKRTGSDCSSETHLRRVPPYGRTRHV